MAPTVTCHPDHRVEADGILLLRRQIGDTITLTVGGEIDLATAGHLAECLDPCVAAPGAQPVVVDLSEVTLLAAAGISGLSTRTTPRTLTAASCGSWPAAARYTDP